MTHSRERMQKFKLRTLQIRFRRIGLAYFSSRQTSGLISEANALRRKKGQEPVNDIGRALDILVGLLGPDTEINMSWSSVESLRSSPQSDDDHELPDTQVEGGEFAPKGTDEVAPQSDNPSQDSPMHGGNNSSQEVPDGHGSGGSNEGSSTPKKINPVTADQAEQVSQPRASRADSGRACQPAEGHAEAVATSETEQITSESPAEVEGGEDAPVEEQGEADSAALLAQTDPQREGDIKTADRPRDDRQPAGEQASAANADNAEMAKAAEVEDVQVAEAKLLAEEVESAPQKSKLARKFSASEGKSSRTDRNQNGGVTALLREAQVTPALLKEARRRLGALVFQSDQEASPRRDYGDFCIRLKTFRNPAPARREEHGRPAILVLPDVSGSCAGFSHQSLAVARACGRLGIPGCDVVLVSHSNGFPIEGEVNGRPLPRSLFGEFPSPNAFFREIISQYNVLAVIALGDYDALDQYAGIASNPNVESMLWLDNYACNHGPVKDDTARARKAIRECLGQNQAAAKVTYRHGCKTGEDFVGNIFL